MAYQVLVGPVCGYLRVVLCAGGITLSLLERDQITCDQKSPTFLPLSRLKSYFNPGCFHDGSDIHSLALPIVSCLALVLRDTTPADSEPLP